MKKSVEDIIQHGRSQTMKELKKSAFDFIAIAIVAALVLASLDVFNLVDLNTMNIGDFVVSWVPYFLATILLTLDLYKKGVFVGKSTDKFQLIVKSYSDLVDSLSGKQIRDLGPFCEKYNENALIDLRTFILKEDAISYDDFNSAFTVNGKTYAPLKTWTKEELTNAKYTKAQIKAIKDAKKAKVKGINVNILLSNVNISDPTDIGRGEIELEKRILVSSVIKYLVSTMLMSLIVIKDITVWGWASLIGVLFKVIYMFARSFMSYFDGYDDITVSVANHITRKTDILKMYLDYIPPVTVTEETET
jgi:hypothetical protein